VISLRPRRPRARTGRTRNGQLAATVAIVFAATLAACSNGDDTATTTTVADAPLADAATETTAPTGPPPGAELEGLRELEPGQCFDTVDDPVAGDKAVYLVDCADPHTYEVYDVVDYGDADAAAAAAEGGAQADEDGADEDSGSSGRSAGYPGAATVQNLAEQACFDRFEAFVGVRWTLSELDIQVWWPSEDSWERTDRSIICAVVSASGDPLTGSQGGTRR
jgi:Septum formation